MQGYHTGLPHLLFPSKQHIKHDKRVKQCLKLKMPAGRRAHSMRKNARRLGGTTPCAKTPTSWASALHAQKCPPAGRAHSMRKNARQLGWANTIRKNARRQAGAPNSI